MFTTTHFIWLGVFALLIAIALILLKKFNVKHIIVQRVVCVLLVILKLFHISLSMIEVEGGGYVLDQTQLSFHLCSIMIYANVLINVIKNEKIIKTLKTFMVPAMMIGALMAMLIPTAGVDPSVPRVWEYMLCHAVMVFYGIYLMAIEKVDLSFKAYLTNLKILVLIVAVAFLMNSILAEYNTNYLFLRNPPMENLPILNLNNGWFVYFITLSVIACLLIFIVHMPFIIKDCKKIKK